MTLGHFATALIPHQQIPKAPIWLFLLAASFQDFLWLVLTFFGLEVPYPSSLFEASFLGLRVDMNYSHDLIPSVFWSILFTTLAWTITKNLIVGVWCGALVMLHEICDLLVGFPHHIMGPESPKVGFALYSHQPELGLILELVFALICLAWFLRRRQSEGHPVSPKRARLFYATFVIGILMWMPLSRHSMKDIFSWFAS